MAPESWSLSTSIGIFILSGLAIAICGVQLTHRAEVLARVTGIGQAILGAVFLGVTTSLAGTVTSINAALNNVPDIAISNAIGGIAAQTTFLVLADIVYRNANLEHAAASAQNLFQAVLLVLLLAIALVASTGPGYTLLQIDIFSFLLVLSYGFGIMLISTARNNTMWQPQKTELTNEEPTDTNVEDNVKLPALILQFMLLATVVAAAGWFTSHAAINISQQSGLSQTLVGTLFTSVSTSIPELVIALTAVRNGAVNLAVGNIIGGNTFDVLFLVASDVAYRKGSIYQVMNQQHQFWLALNLVLIAILLLGMLKREKHGAANIGFEGVAVLLCYLSSVVLLVWTG